jgi:hypothetical protein
MVDTGEMNALYKANYAKKMQDLIPKAGKITKRHGFEESLQNGTFFELPVILTAENGFTYNVDDQTAYDLNASRGMNMQSAQVPGADIVLQGTIGYNQSARGSHAKTSFKAVLPTKLENMVKSHTKRLEINYLYGQTPLATAAAQLVPTANPLPIVFDADSWAVGMWAGQETALVCFSVASSGAVVDSLGNYSIAKVDVDTRTIYFSAGTGDLAALETAIEADALNIHFFSSVYDNSGTVGYKEAAGFKKIITNTGLLFNINAATYNLWKGNTFAVGGGQLTFGKVQSGTALAVGRGLESDATLWVNPKTWSNMNNNQAALRQYDSSYSKKKSENGSQVLEFVSQNGLLKVEPYSLVKEGDAFLVPDDKVMRVGAWELSLGDPAGGPDRDIFFQLENNAGAGVRSYSNCAIFITAPAQSVYFSGIVNS